MRRVLQQFNELKAHFEEVYRTDKCVQAEALISLFNDQEIKVYLVFTKYILEKVALSYWSFTQYLSLLF